MRSDQSRDHGNDRYLEQGACSGGEPAVRRTMSAALKAIGWAGLALLLLPPVILIPLAVLGALLFCVGPMLDDYPKE